MSTVEERKTYDVNHSPGSDQPRDMETQERNWGKADRGVASEEELSRLHKTNIVVGVIQLATGAVLLGITSYGENQSRWYTNFPVVPEDPPYGAPEADELFKFNPGVFSGIFLLMSALDHLLVATCFRGAYENGVRKSRNIFRWVEYAFSAPLMHVLIALLSGVGDIFLLWSIFGFVHVTMIFGALFEVENGMRSRSSVNWVTFFLGFIPFFFAWAIILSYFFRNVSYADPPDFVWAIIVVELVINSLFPVALALQWIGDRCCSAKFASYAYGEFIFIILSLVSKQLLAWINYGGAEA